jgi:hypothetical protein
MNIFILDENPDTAARQHCDKHVVKMILETAQMLCTAHWQSGGVAPYKSTHKNHPCTIWARESVDNYKWLCDLGVSLCDEYTQRYGKVHKTQAIIEWLVDNVPNIPDVPMTPFAQAMPDEYKSSSAVEAYRKYYLGEKREIAAWKYSEKPQWFVS